MHKLIQAAVFAAIGVLVFASLLIPVVNDANKVNDMFDNSDVSITEMKPFEIGDEWARNSDNGEWSLNGTVVSNLNQGAYSAILTETLAGRSNGQFRGATIAGNMAGATGIVIDETTLQLSGAGIQGAATQTYTKGYGLTDSGDFVLTKYANARSYAYLLGNTEIYATGTTAGTNLVNTVVHIEGNIKDGVTVTATPLYNTGTNRTVTVENIVINSEKVPGYTDLYKFTDIQFTITETDTSTDTTETVNASYSAVVIPKTIVAEKAIHADEPTRDILAMLPLILICALIMGVVGYAVYSRIE